MRKKGYTPVYNKQLFFFPEKEVIFTQLTEFGLKNKNMHHYVLVSGGSDSMCLIHVLFDYFFTHGLDMSRLHICHYNHKQRDESTEEEKFIQIYFSDVHVIFGSYTGEGSSERELRIAREVFVGNCIRDYGKGYVYTGHHLQDRFETSCLHMIRGCREKGIYNMSMIDEKRISTQKIIYIRPLLSLTKQTIERICLENDIPYHIDASNSDICLSKRNKIRWYIKQITHHGLPYFNSFYEAYTTRKKTNKPMICCTLVPLPEWNVSQYIKVKKPKDYDDVYTIFQFLHAIGGLTEKRMAEFGEFLIHKHAGWKYVGGRYICICHGFIYCLFSGDTHPFWYTSREHISEAKEIGTRYFQDGDRYTGKKVTKRMTEKKIPFFLRPYIPLVDDKGVIIDILFTPDFVCSM